MLLRLNPREPVWSVAIVRGGMVGTESVARPGPVLPAGDRFGRCAIAGTRRRDAASLDAEGREPAIGGKRSALA